MQNTYKESTHLTNNILPGETGSCVADSVEECENKHTYYIHLKNSTCLYAVIIIKKLLLFLAVNLQQHNK